MELRHRHRIPTVSLSMGWEMRKAGYSYLKSPPVERLGEEADLCKPGLTPFDLAGGAIDRRRDGGERFR